MSQSGAGWLSRTQKRRNGELALLRVSAFTPPTPGSPSSFSNASKRPSMVPSTYSVTTINSDYAPEFSPSSPHGSVSTGASSIVDSFERLQALQNQLKNNTMQMEANEARMRQIEANDTRIAADVQERLSAVMELNQRLNLLRSMMLRAEKIQNGDFGASC